MGFDGRSPNDKMFWKNSDKHFYQEDVEQLMALHPAFYNMYVPKNKPEVYVKKYHGKSLDNILRSAEQAGFEFEMMHFSYTETLNKRFKGINYFKDISSL